MSHDLSPRGGSLGLSDLQELTSTLQSQRMHVRQDLSADEGAQVEVLGRFRDVGDEQIARRDGQVRLEKTRVVFWQGALAENDHKLLQIQASGMGS